MDAADNLTTFSSPGLFWGNRALKPMTFLALIKVDVWMDSFCVETNQLTPSLQGGVVKEPLYLNGKC
jgi:hypothetical protein